MYHCGTWKGLRGVSFFENNRLSLMVLFKMMIHWVLQTKFKDLKAIFPCSRQFVYDFYHCLRYAVLKDYHNTVVMLGGPGIVVEIDEWLFMKVSIYKTLELT